MAHCDKLTTAEEKIEYLEHVKKEYRKRGKELTPIDRTDLLIKKIDYIIDKYKIIMKYESENEAPEKRIEKFHFLGTETQIVYIFEQLLKSGFINPEREGRIYKLISVHFKNKFGKSYKNTQLATTSQNLIYNKTSKPKRSNDIDSIIESAKDITD